MTYPDIKDYDNPEDFQEALEDYYGNVDYEYDEMRDDALTEL